MAKGQDRGATEYVALPKGSVSAFDGDEPVTDEELAFDEFVAGMSAERMGELRIGKIKVEKDGTPLANSKGAHCFSCPIDQFTYSGLLEHIRRRHGAGLYRVVGVEAGKRGLAFNRLIEIAEELNPPAPTESPLQNPMNYLESVGKIMADSAARTEALISRTLENRAPATDPMESMMKMAGFFQSIFATMAPMFQGKGAGGGDDILSQAEKLFKLKALLVGEGSSGDSDKESNFYDVVKQGLASFGPALAALAVQKSQQANLPPPIALPPQPPIGSDPRTYTAPPTPAAVPTGNDPMLASLKKQVDLLVMNAKNGADPAQLANVILDMTPDEKIDDLGAMLDDPGMVDKMAALNPEVAHYRDFFEKLRANLLGLLGDGQEDTLAPAGNNAPNSGSAPAPASGASTT